MVLTSEPVLWSMGSAWKLYLLPRPDAVSTVCMRGDLRVHRSEVRADELLRGGEGAEPAAVLSSPLAL